MTRRRSLLDGPPTKQSLISVAKAVFEAEGSPGIRPMADKGPIPDHRVQENSHAWIQIPASSPA
jgi:hypothetical protein